MDLSRPAFAITTDQPGSELAGESAAALAAASIFYTNIGETDLANEALSHARQLFDFADNYRGTYNDVIPDIEDFYGYILSIDMMYQVQDHGSSQISQYFSSYAYGDELVWAACWLAKATGESQYRIRAEEIYNEFGLDYRSTEGMGWDDKTFALHIMLYEITGDSSYESLVTREIDYYLNQATYTPQGMMYICDWGTLPCSLNTVLALLHVILLAAHQW
jgi:endoglucanase